MSMPNFPEGILEITCQQAFHLLLGSIAMEELGLSHILNAEGEKLQYILGTFPGAPRPCATPREVIEVNRSVSELLERVAYNQLLLKGKLQQVLEARESCCPPEPLCPPEPCLCVWTAEKGARWSCGAPLPWKPACAKGGPIAWQKCSSAALYLAPGLSYFTSFSFRVRPCEPGPVQIALRESKGGRVVSLCRGEGEAGGPVALTGSALLPAREGAACPLQFVLEGPQAVTVERGEWTLMAL